MGIFIAIGLGILPSIIWLIFFDQEDRHHPESFRNLSFAFILGCFTTFFALAVQLGLNYLFEQYGVGIKSTFAVSVFATIEEIFKFLAVIIMIRSASYFDEPLDAMIFMVTVALGFAAVENVASLINQAGVLEAGITSKAYEVLVIRFLGATLLHSLTSAVVGFHWAVGIIAKKFVGWHIFIGLVVASSLHSVFNYLILRTGPTTWAITFVVIISFFVLIDFEQLKRREVAAGLKPTL